MDKEKIQINQEKDFYKIEEIRQQSDHILKIVFTDTIPEKFGDIAVYTAGGIQCANISGYDTIYQDNGKTVYLSNDGSIYQLSERPPE